MHVGSLSYNLNIKINDTFSILHLLDSTTDRFPPPPSNIQGKSPKSFSVHVCIVHRRYLQLEIHQTFHA